MREILCRGKCSNNGKWVEGYYAKIPYYLGDKEIHIIIPVDAKLYPRCEISHYEEVDPETVGRYIGANDEDDRKVFEGDVLERTRPFGVIERISIGYERSSFGYRTILPNTYNYLEVIDDNEFGIAVGWFKVIGNIHDNPELLKGETNNEG